MIKKKNSIPKSMDMQKRASRIIPGGTQLLSKRPDMFSAGIWPGYYKKAQGAYVWDLDGNRYLDMSIGGIGANVLGYADPDINRAVKDAIDLGSSCSLNCPEEVELAELLCEIHPWADMARFARTGGEAMAIAVRIARASSGNDIVAFCGYHGWHDWYLAANLAGDNTLNNHLLPGLSPVGVPKGLSGTALPFKYNQIEDLKSILAKHKDQVAAIVMEPIRNEYPKNSFLEDVQHLAEENGSVLIFDEISAGFRMNSGGAHLELGLIPDLAVFSKALGNGFPIAALVGKEKVMDAVQESFISSTMWSERIGPVAALATIKKHQRIAAGTQLMARGKQVQEGWARLAEKNGLEITVGGIPPLSHFAFESSNSTTLKAYFVQLLLERGVLASTTFYAMCSHTKEYVEQYLSAVDEVFSLLYEAQQSNDLEKRLRGAPACFGFKRLT